MKKLILFFFILLLFKAEAQSVSALVVSRKADSLFELGDYSRAIEQYKKIETKHPSNVKIAKAYEALGNIPEAIHYYEKANSADKTDAQIKFNFAKLLVKALKYQKADSIFENLAKQFPKNPNFIYQRALIKEAKSDSTAIEYYKRAYLLDTNNINSAYKIARYFVENRKFKEAEPFVNKGLSVNNNSVRFLTLQALQQFYTEDYHNSISTYIKLISLGVSNIQIHENLASCYSFTNQIEKALEQFKILLEQFDDKNPKWHVKIATLYRSLKDYKNAEHHINIAIGLQEIPLSESFMKLARIYKRQEDSKAEINALKSALINNPNNESALYSLAVAADNYFADKELVLRYYEDYLKKYADKGRTRDLAKQRVKDLKKELFFSED